MGAAGIQREILTVVKQIPSNPRPFVSAISVVYVEPPDNYRRAASAIRGVIVSLNFGIDRSR